LVGVPYTIVLMLADSTPAVEATWRDFSERHGLDLTMVLQSEQIDRYVGIDPDERQQLMECALSIICADCRA
jgi:hypothetical protein